MGSPGVMLACFVQALRTEAVPAVGLDSIAKQPKTDWALEKRGHCVSLC